MTRWAEIVLGALFIAAAVLKALDLGAFAVQVSLYGVVREPSLVRAVAWCALALETSLGAALLTGLRLRGWTAAVTALTLLGFTGLIGYGWAYHGLQDCGCFGKYLKSSPGVSIVKNGVMLVMSAMAWFGARRTLGWPSGVADPLQGSHRWLVAGLSIASVGVALWFGPPGAAANGTTSGAAASTAVTAAVPFAQFKFDANGRAYDLGRGDYLVAMLSATCDHCKASVEPLNNLQLTPEFPTLVALMLGDDLELAQFRAETNPEFPTVLVKDALTFFQFIGKEPPRFVLIREGKEVQHWDTTVPTPEEVMKAKSATGS